LLGSVSYCGRRSRSSPNRLPWRLPLKSCACAHSLRRPATPGRLTSEAGRPYLDAYHLQRLVERSPNIDQHTVALPADCVRVPNQRVDHKQRIRELDERVSCLTVSRQLNSETKRL
jgi:hypothetical protein